MDVAIVTTSCSWATCLRHAAIAAPQGDTAVAACLGVHPVCATPPDHGHAVVEGEVGINILWTGGGKRDERDERKIEIERVRVRLTVVSVMPRG